MKISHSLAFVIAATIFAFANTSCTIAKDGAVFSVDKEVIPLIKILADK